MNWWPDNLTYWRGNMSMIRSTLAFLFTWCLFPPSSKYSLFYMPLKKLGIGRECCYYTVEWVWNIFEDWSYDFELENWLNRYLRSLRKMRRIEQTSNSIKRDHSLHYQFRWDTSRQLRRQTLIRVRVRDIAFFPTDQVLGIAKDQLSLSGSEVILHSSDRTEGIKRGFSHR